MSNNFSIQYMPSLRRVLPYFSKSRAVHLSPALSLMKGEKCTLRTLLQDDRDDRNNDIHWLITFFSVSKTVRQEKSINKDKQEQNNNLDPGLILEQCILYQRQ